MADIQMRFHKDMLALTSPLKPVLRHQGFDTRDLAQAHFIEEDTLREGYRMLCASMAPVIVTETADFLPARLAHAGLSDKLPELARVALSIVNSFKPQHILVELGESGLPLDPTSKTSLLEHRSQYERAGKAFEEACAGVCVSSAKTSANRAKTGMNTSLRTCAPCAFDAFLLSGFTSTTTLKCALMGLAKVSSKPVFATVCVDADGNLLKDAGWQNKGWRGAHTDSHDDCAKERDAGSRNSTQRIDEGDTSHEEAKRNPKTPASETLASAYEIMAEYGASVIGFQTAADTEHMFDMAKLAVEKYNLPAMVEILAGKSVSSRLMSSDLHSSATLNSSNKGSSKSSKPGACSTSSPYTNPNDMFEVAERMHNAGVQFLRAAGDSTPAFASALAASCAGVDVKRITTYNNRAGADVKRCDL